MRDGEPLHPERDWTKVVDFSILSTQDLLNYHDIQMSLFLNFLENLSLKDYEIKIQKIGNKTSGNIYRECRGHMTHEYEHIEIMKQRISSLKF